MELILIAAMAKNRVIGKNNKIPWHIPDEMRHFKETTMGHAVIMGRKTFESIKTPLPGRLNVVLTRNPDLRSPGFHFTDSIEKGIDYCRNQKQIFIIGGQSIFQKSMKIVDTILLSVLDEEYDGDAVFPHISMKNFRKISEKRIGESQPFTLFTFQRKKKTDAA
ncbi:MAG TPA: dihydrofolate reductase [Desulfobacterales bacterium]|nr:dihydrofolate reductase [Desulfobacterales bacterium]HIP40009.1 dihydrofolate reductase [Desulfocapsa sulfexigens]